MEEEAGLGEVRGQPGPVQSCLALQPPPSLQA